MVRRGIEESAALGVPEVGQHLPDQLVGRLKPPQLKSRFVKIHKGLGHLGVIVEIRRELAGAGAGAAVVAGAGAGAAIGPQQNAVANHVGEHEIGRPLGGFPIAIFAQELITPGQCRDHHAVGRRQDLVVFAGPGAPAPQGEQLRPKRCQATFQRLGSQVPVACKRPWIAGDVEDIAALEVPLRRDAVIVAEKLAVLFAQRGQDLFRPPNVELALFSFAVGIFGTVKAAAAIGHVAKYVVEDLFRHPAIEIVAGRLPRLEVDLGEKCVVVEHLLEVRNEPVGVDRVAVKAPADLVAHSAVCHPVQRDRGHGEKIVLAGVQVLPQQKRNGGARGKLGRPAETAPRRIEFPSELGGRLREDGFVQRAGACCRRNDVDFQRTDHLIGTFDDLVTPLAPRLGGGGQNLFERGHAEAVFRREIRSPEKRLQVRRQKDVQRPTAAAGHHLNGRHVNLVDVRPLLAIDLDGDKVLVEDLGGLGILERLPLHDVAPMTCRVADG